MAYKIPTQSKAQLREQLQCCMPGSSLAVPKLIPRSVKSGQREVRHRLRVSASQQSGTNLATAVSEQPQETYDVYIHEPQPLQEGEEKHVISVFVADEAGMINRVAGVFARRGANIESLAVGLNIDKALFTIALTGTPANVANLVKQLSKLVKVRYVEDVTSSLRVERELVLLKLRVPPGPARTEVMQLVDIFRARVVDVSDRALTVSVTGDAGKTEAMQRALAKFGIIEIARTGKISLKRGEQLLEMGGWGDGFKRKEKVRRAATDAKPANGAMEAAASGADGDAVNGAAQAEEEEEEGDVYVTEEDSPGVWEVENVLDAAYQDRPQYEPHTLSIEVEDRSGVLNQVTGVFARRGYNVQSLAVGNSEVEGRSRIIMVVPGTGAGISNLIKQLNKLVYIHKVTDLSPVPFVARELMLVKVRCAAGQRRELSDLAHTFHGTICDVSLATVTLEVEGKEEKMAALQTLLEPYGVLEVARTGRVAVVRDSGVSTRYLEGFKRTRVML